MRIHDVLIIGLAANDDLNAVAIRHNLRLTYALDAHEAQVFFKASASFDLTCIVSPSGAPNPIASLRKCPSGLLVAILEPSRLPTSREWISQGASEVLPAPLKASDFEALVLRSERVHALIAENQYHRTNVSQPMEELVGRSDAWLKVRKAQEHTCNSCEHILITGEVGTGKNAFARAIHRRSTPSGGALIRVDCAAWPGSLLETEIFGNSGEKNSRSRRRGAFDLARGGTLVLSVFEKASLAVQDKLLKALQEQRIKNEGAVRLICISTSDSNKFCGNGTFRDEFIALLAPIHLPPLRQRSGDIIMLAEYFLRQTTDPYARPRLSFDLEAKDMLLSYSWPGNARELKNAIERAVIASSSPVVTAAALGLSTKGAPSNPIQDFPPPVAPTIVCAPIPVSSVGNVSFRVGQPLHEIESEMLLRTMELTRNNRTKAATILGISVRTLYSKLLEIEQRQKMLAKSNSTLESVGEKANINSQHDLASA